MMDIQYKIYEILRCAGIIQLSEEIILDLTALLLIIGKNRMEEIIRKVNSNEHDNQYMYECMKNELDNDRIATDILDNVFKYFNGQILPCKQMVNIMSMLLSMNEEQLFEIIDGNNQVDIYMIKAEKSYSSSDTSWINKLVVQILEQHGGKTLFNADCGAGRFLTMAYNANLAKNIIGYCYSEGDYRKSSVRAYVKNKKDISVHQKSFFCEPLSKKVDMIYAEYPFNIRYEYQEIEPMITKWKVREKLTFEKKYSSNMLCILNMLESLSDKGILVTLVPNGGLFNSNDTEIRKYLVENNYIDTIISLPPGIFPTSGVKTSMIILKKDRFVNDNISMIDASEIFQKQRRYNLFSDENINQIMNMYKYKEESKISFEVSKDKIIENNYNLGLGKYMKHESPLINPHTLGSVSEKIFRGYQAKASDLDAMATEDEDATDYRIVNVSDIQLEGYVNESLKPVVIDEPKRFEKYCLMDGDILITAKNTIVKTAVYKQRDNIKVILTGNLIAIRVNKDKINPYYLKTFLDSESGQAAIKSIQTGTSVISINPNSLKDMRISLLPSDQQEKLAKKFCNKLNEIEELLDRYKILSTEIASLFDMCTK